MNKKNSLNILLGFDFGTKYIGIAVGQTVTQTARALTSIKATMGIPEWTEIDALVSTWRPDAFVVGIPLNMDGTEQPLTQLAKKFANILRERYQLPVYDMDERLTTVAAKDQLFTQGGYKALDKKNIDSVSAQLILQNWLTQQGK
jgi:putative holliday junction resolvase